MSNHDTKRLTMAHALRSGICADVVDELPTDAEISQMLVDNGEDPDIVVQQYKNLIAGKIRAAKKEKLLSFRTQDKPRAGVALRGVRSMKEPSLPDIALMRKKIVALSTTPEFDKSNLAIAYRNGTKQSDSDISSLYQDLVDLGVIQDDSEN